MDGSDEQIIEEAGDVCKALDLKLRIRQLYWIDRTVGRKFKADECHFSLGLATFPVSMKGRLDPKEWRPLIASTMIYRKIISRNPSGSFVFTFAALFGLLVGGLGILSKLFGSSRADLPSFLYIVLVIAPFLANRTTSRKKEPEIAS